ncbi:MAG: DUF1848 domain-containing protein [Actinomycetia bacterium]|nr:DUF1848 domain-containing protein [Actinomycetes bacterium]
MIISASRRTDIPAFYSEWFLNRVRAGRVAVPNPRNLKQVDWVSLRPADVDALVLWTRNAGPLLRAFDELDARGLRYYIQYTLTGYPRRLEPGLPPLAEAIRIFQQTGERLGRERVIWRYDPIMFLSGIDERYHWDKFADLCRALAPYTEQCVISFLDVYRKTVGNLAKALGGRGEEPSPWPLNMPVEDFAAELGAIARAQGLRVTTCAEQLDLGAFGIHPGRCIDPGLIGRVLGVQVAAVKDPNQREACGCVVSKDIGMYDSCPHGCAYCYANASLQKAVDNYRLRHDPRSAALLGWVGDEGD